MKIACLAWGSLVWDPRTLPRAGSFRDDGVRLPIEFSRVSLDGRVTLIIDPTAPQIRSLWAPLAVDSLDAAIEQLGRREGIVPDRWSDWVGRHALGEPVPEGPHFRDLDSWLGERSLDAVVWTALPGRQPGGEETLPTLETLLAHLGSLSGEALSRAERYVRRTPRVVQTPRRARFEAELGWTAEDDR